MSSNKGIYLTLSSAFLTSVWTLGAKRSELPVGELTFVTYVLLFVISAPLAWKSGEKLIPRNDLLTIWAQSFFNVAILLLTTSAIRLMPMADETLLTYSSTLFTVLFGHVFLGEKCDAHKVTCACLIILGSIMIIGRPASAYPNYVIGSIMAITVAVCDAADYIVVKKVVHLHYAVLLAQFSLASIFLTLPFCLFETWTPSLSLCWLPMISSIQEALIIMALYVEQASIVSLVHASDIVFIYVWELVFFRETYSYLRIMGSCLITLAVSASLFTPRESYDRKEKTAVITI